MDARIDTEEGWLEVAWQDHHGGVRVMPERPVLELVAAIHLVWPRASFDPAVGWYLHRVRADAFLGWLLGDFPRLREIGLEVELLVEAREGDWWMPRRDETRALRGKRWAREQSDGFLVPRIAGPALHALLPDLAPRVVLDSFFESCLGPVRDVAGAVPVCVRGMVLVGRRVDLFGSRYVVADTDFVRVDGVSYSRVYLVQG